MFTGLIETVGEVYALNRSGKDWLLSVRSNFDLSDVKEGDSIAVNGACLTVIGCESDRFTVQVSDETVKRTTFQKLRPGHAVNLEKAMAADARFHGHMVQGHVDAVARVVRLVPRGRSQEIHFALDGETGRYLVSKGSIAIDGVSLTLNDVQDSGGETRFTVNIIPHTQKKTTLQSLSPGTEVNIETDILGRYIERLLKSGIPYQGNRPLDREYLLQKGFV
ncbi:riboflavin synthase [Magnetococcales bacterium HHB-1]